MAEQGGAGRMGRRQFLCGMTGMAALALGGCDLGRQMEDKVATVQAVLGPVPAHQMGFTLAHEHVMCDFAGADKTTPARWDADEIVERMEPYLREIVARGVQAFVDCSPAFLGRDVTVLRRLSERTGLHILTNTGWYKEPYLPPRAFALDAEAIAAEWISEWQNGIEGTAIKPGFVKIAVNPGPLIPVQRKIVRAAALTSLATGLAIASHTGHAVAAQESLDIAEAAGLDLSRYIIVHAQNIRQWGDHVALANRGAWLEYDGIGPGTVQRHVDLVLQALEKGYQDQVMLSHDAGWYSVGEPNGGDVRPFTCLFEEFLPALQARGVDETTIQKLCAVNPARAFRACFTIPVAAEHGIG